MKTAFAIGLVFALMIAPAFSRLCAAEPKGDAPIARPTTRPVTKPATKPATRPTTRPASRPTTTSRPTTRIATTRPGAHTKTPEQKAAEDAIKVAVTELTKEAQDTFRKEGGILPRGEPDYFKDKTPGIDQDTLITALTKSINRDPRIDAYVKLQLLSAVEKFDASHAVDAIDAYVAAPALVPLNGIAPRDTQTWDRKSATAKKDDIARINGEFREERDKAVALNDPMIAYRNALADRILTDDTTKPRLLEAKVEELSQRATAGFDTRKLWTTLAGEIKAWSSNGSKKQIDGMITFLKEYARRTGPQVYDELTWSNRGKTGKPDWKDHKAVLDEKRMSTLLEDLTTAERNAL